MDRPLGRLGWLRRLWERLGARKVYESPISFIVRRADEGEDEDEGPGVPVPAGPRPRRGGASAQPPRSEEAPEVHR